MTIRAITLGLMLGLLVSGFTYFNDWVIRQTYVIGNHLPIGVFGPALLVLLLANPLLGRISRRAALAPGEIAVAIAIGLAACAWPGSNLLRVFTHVVARPIWQQQVRQTWQSQEVFSYVPGTSARLAEGFVTDWEALVRALAAGAEDRAGATAAGRLWSLFDAETQRRVAAVAALPAVPQTERRVILDAINAALPVRELFPDATLPADASTIDVAWHHRDQLTQALAGVIRPALTGGNLLLNDARYDPIHEPLMTGLPEGQSMSWLDLPWRDWAPTMALWLGLALLVGLATVCLVLIVHPQWAHRELLLYPTVQFVREVTDRGPHAVMPAIFRNRLFWAGFVIVAIIHTVNGLNQWFPDVPRIQRQFLLWPIADLFPNAKRVSGSWAVFAPALFFTAIGFGYFINTRVSISIGLSPLAWVVVGAMLIANGQTFSTDRFDPEAMANTLRFGSWLGAAAMILYYGRRHYAHVMRGMIGLPTAVSTPRYCIWAARGLVVCCLLSIALLMHQASLTLTMSVIFILVVLVMSLVLTRINAETGLFYAQPDFLPAALIAGLFGLQGVGPDTLVVLTYAGIMLVIDPREALMPYVANGVRMAEDVGDARPTRSVWPITAMLLVGLVFATIVTLTLQYNKAMTPHDGWAINLAQAPLNWVGRQTAELSVRGELPQATDQGWLDHFRQMKPEKGYLGFLLAGLILYVACAIARLRMPAWPLHPILFLVWGTYPVQHFAFSFLLAGLIKESIVRTGGITMYQRFKPFMVGMIAGEIIAAIGWMIVGTWYYLATGLPPEAYRLLPG